MKQLTQKLRNGQLQVLDVPTPVLGKGMVLVRNHYSLISAGTEGSTVSAARRSFIGKVKERPQQVKQVIDVLLQQGPIQTYRAVMKKLDSYSALGYSSAGEIIHVAPDVKGFSVGDLVACGGAGYANHAEVVAVPINLCVKLPQSGNLRLAAYNTLGAIALQGIRQTDLRIGETCVVIGLGLIGHLTCLMLKAGGIKVIGVDIDSHAVGIAGKHCAEFAFVRSDAGLAEKIDELTGRIGADATIITAATDSTDPINLAGRVLRKRGRVVILGAVPTGFDRDPYFYRKELELRMSCSYGPGRYDSNYEEKGVDYPAGYVRWTENRNMMAFQELVHSGKIDLGYLTTHHFKVDDAPSAYDIILEKTEPYLGILIEYDTIKEHSNRRVLVSKSHASNSLPSNVSIAFVGAGSYAMSHLLPNIPKGKDVALKGVMTSSGTSSRSVAEKYSFEFCTSDDKDIFENTDINTVFVATRHDSHGKYVLKALNAAKNVFVEKPLCLSEAELEGIKEVYTTPAARNSAIPLLMIGFNRRFSPLTEIIKQKISEGPMSMIYRVNAGYIAPDSWIHDKSIGGGRIIGEVCHFVDYLTFLNGSLPCGVFASVLPDPAGCEDTVTINLRFWNGSIGTIAYFANGSKGLFKEYVEVHQAGVTAVITDFKELRVYGNGRPFRKKLFSQDKGQKDMVRAFVEAVRAGGAAPIPFEDIYAVTLTTFKILESVHKNERVEIPEPMSAR